MKQISVCLSLLTIAYFVGPAISFPNVQQEFTADWDYSFNDDGTLWNASGKMYSLQNQNLLRQDYSNERGEKVQFFQMSKSMADFYLVTYSAKPTCTRNTMYYPGFPWLFEDTEAAKYVGKVKKGNQNLDLWQWSNVDNLKSWYIDEKSNLARYEHENAWAYRKISFKNIINKVNKTQDFAIPKICF